MKLLAPLIGGILFGSGLVVSGMSDPTKVLAFLTISQDWDPSLLVVMISALVVTAIGYRLVFARRTPLWASEFSLPTSTNIDRRILVGAGLFGIGWGLAGYCPGPAVVGSFLLDVRALAFFAAYLIGFGGWLAWDRIARARVLAQAVPDG